MCKLWYRTVGAFRSAPKDLTALVYNFSVNVLDPCVVRPVAVAWHDYVPQPARNGLGNFTSNLEEPAIMVNYFPTGRSLSGHGAPHPASS